MTQQERIQLLTEIKINPNLALLHFAENLEAKLTAQMGRDMENLMETIKSQMTDMFITLEEKLSVKIDTIKEEVKKPLDSKLMNHITQLKGDKGDSPTDDEITGLIQPLIPIVRDGHTPTDEELLAIIKPLIPVVKDGETPSDEKLLSLIRPLIPVVKDGETPSDEQLLSLIKPLIPKPIELGKPIELANKLNTTEDSVEQKVIKGLPKTIENLQKAIREKGGGKSGGGGMGNWLHESKSVDATTTSVSTNNKIAANGFAVFAFYQGQMIARSTHYTVNSDRKTLPLLFTPQGSSTIDIIYIRS